MLLKRLLFLSLLIVNSAFAFLPMTTDLVINTTPAYCARPLNCVYGANYLTLSDANSCGCCTCHGGAIGCAGGAKGRVICADTTIADACNCQYLITPASLGYNPAPVWPVNDSL